MGKPEDILVEFSRSRINEEAVNVEKVYFYKTDKRDWFKRVKDD